MSTAVSKQRTSQESRARESRHDPQQTARLTPQSTVAQTNVPSEFNKTGLLAGARQARQQSTNNSDQIRQLKFFNEMAQAGARTMQLNAMSTTMRVSALKKMALDKLIQAKLATFRGAKEQESLPDKSIDSSIVQRKVDESQIVQRYVDKGDHRMTDDGNYATLKSDPFILYVKDGAVLPQPTSFFSQTSASSGWKVYVPRTRLYSALLYPDFDGPNDCGMYATGLAKNNPQWGRIRQTYSHLIGKETGRYPHQDNFGVHANLWGGKNDREIDPAIGEVLLIQPPQGSVSGLGGSSLFAERCNFHASPVVVKAGGDYITNEADAGDKSRTFPHWEIYGSQKEQTFHYKNAIKYKDKFGFNPTDKEWPQTYALKAPARFQNSIRRFTRSDGTVIYSVDDTTYNISTHHSYRNNNFVADLGSAIPFRYEILSTEVTYPDGVRVCHVHDGVNNVKSYVSFGIGNNFIADLGLAWIKPGQYQTTSKKWTFLNGTEVWLCHDLYNNVSNHILVNPSSHVLLNVLGAFWMEPGVRYEYLRREVTYFGGDQVSYAHDGRTGTKRYIKFTATGQFLEDLGVFWNKPSQYELLELQQRLGNGIEIHYAHDRYANQQTYIKIDTRRQTVVSDLGKSWRRG